VRILKDFKSCVLEVQILQGLQTRFSYVWILKQIASNPEKDAENNWLTGVQRGVYGEL